jgi:crossover junction endodeoxyribonuclease RusA
MPVSTLRLSLPLPPGVNNQYATVGKRRVLSKDARAFNRGVSAVTRALLKRDDVVELLPAMQEKPFACDLVFYFETPFRRDLDGGLKIALDAVCDGLGLDDRYIVSISLEKRIDPLHPRLEMEIGPAEGWRFDREYVVLE